MVFFNYPAVIVAKFETVRGASNYDFEGNEPGILVALLSPTYPVCGLIFFRFLLCVKLKVVTVA